MSLGDSDTGINRNSIKCKVSQERGRKHICSVQVSTQETMSCPAFIPEGVLTVYTPTTRLNRPGLLKMCQHCREKGKKDVLGGETR